jgi:hypothetical protein
LGEYDNEHAMDIAATFNGKRGQRQPAHPALSNFAKTASKETQTMDKSVKKCRLTRMALS